MRHANHGVTAAEIAEHLELPPEFRNEAHATGYYGHLAHNVKAVYQRYLSWYDGNPANLWKLPPVEVGRRYVALAGGPDALLGARPASFDDGDYRWVVELVNHLVFADPTNVAARELQADAFEQLGYQSESATFRNAYLMRRPGAAPRPTPAAARTPTAAISPRSRCRSCSTASRCGCVRRTSAALTVDDRVRPARHRRDLDARPRQPRAALSGGPPAGAPTSSCASDAPTSSPWSHSTRRSPNSSRRAGRARP